MALKKTATRKKATKGKTRTKKIPARKKTAHARRLQRSSRTNMRIRMYNVGFGDCFLLTIPRAGGETRILVDCGSVAAGPKSIAQVVESVIADCTDTSGNARIDVVICTHRHRDHVSGFANAMWRNVEVNEVWMPWTEDPVDPAARKIRETQSKLALALQTKFAAAMVNPALSRMPAAQISQLNELMLNALTNEAAMDTLHGGFKGPQKKRFLAAKAAGDMSLETDILPGVTTYVLGPSKDPDVIRDMDPPNGQSYLRIMDGLTEGGLPEPFPVTWCIDDNQALPALSEEDRKAVQNLNSDMDLNVAVSLDKAVNGTSLMLVFKIGSKCLLFPGDAQWGTWQAALKNPDARALMKKSMFYKIGHHGSHNATPPEYVDSIMTDGVLAMCSTRPGSYNEVPREPLLTALGTHAHIARTDEMGSIPGDFQHNGDEYADLEIPLD